MTNQGVLRLRSISKHGLPIGNLTSQIFSNIYLNEFDQFVLHSLKPLGYVRYGDDFVLWFQTELEAKTARIVGCQFLGDELYLQINPKHDTIQPTYKKLSYLGVDIWPNGRRLQPKVWRRLQNGLDNNNLASYQSLVGQHMPDRYKKRVLYRTLDKISTNCYYIDYEN